MKYTEEHEWLRVEGDTVVVGITEHAAEQLGDVVFVELPDEGREVAKGDEVVVIESVKAASDILAPLDGEIVEVNQDVADNPGMVNEDPTGQGLVLQDEGGRSFRAGRDDGRGRLQGTDRIRTAAMPFTPTDYLPYDFRQPPPHRPLAGRDGRDAQGARGEGSR